MDRCRLERIITHFQARARGYLLRNELRRAREDYQDIVKEIHGDLHCLKWTQRALCFPHFTDAHNSQHRDFCDNFENSKSEATVNNNNKCSSRAECGANGEEDGGGLLEKLEAERDISQIIASTPELGGCFPTGAESVNLPTGVDVRVSERDGGVMDSTCDSIAVWSSVDTDLCSSRAVKPGLRQYCLARDVPRNPEALLVHRNTLCMELLWLRQAIDSRKKYLTLKNKLSVS